MTRLDTLFTLLETLRDHDIPRFQLQRRRLSIRGILAGGYAVIASFLGTRCRFTAFLYRGESTHLVCFEHEVDGHWTLGRMETYDAPFMRACCCQFVGCIYSLIATAPEVHQIELGVELDHQPKMDFLRAVTEDIARSVHATLTVNRFRDVMGYTITLPPRRTA